MAFDDVIVTTAGRAEGLGTEAKSMRALARLEAEGYARCANLAPKTFGRGGYGPIDEG